MAGIVAQDSLDGSKSWVSLRGDTEVVGQLGARVVLLQCCCQTFVEIRLEAFAWPDGCDMRDVILFLG